jgi:hypothetical protein
MKRFALLVACLGSAGACGSPTPPADTDARMPGPVDGEWEISWTCLECQPGQINPLAYANRLVIEGSTATYDNPDCGDCGDQHTGAPAADGTCYDVDAGTAGEIEWAAYQLCAFGNTLEGSLTFTGYPGPPEARTYALAGTRP